MWAIAIPANSAIAVVAKQSVLVFWIASVTGQSVNAHGCITGNSAPLFATSTVPGFNLVEFHLIKNEAGLNRFVMSAKQWTERTKGIGLLAYVV